MVPLQEHMAAGAVSCQAYVYLSGCVGPIPQKHIPNMVVLVMEGMWFNGMRGILRFLTRMPSILFCFVGYIILYK